MTLPGDRYAQRLLQKEQFYKLKVVYTALQWYFALQCTPMELTRNAMVGFLDRRRFSRPPAVHPTTCGLPDDLLRQAPRARTNCATHLWEARGQYDEAARP